jgi:hypothetical protein
MHIKMKTPVSLHVRMKTYMCNVVIYHGFLSYFTSNLNLI